jgi:predicted dehydrogenase
MGEHRTVACDKPFGRDAEEAAAMCELARASGVVGLLNFEFRYDPVRERIRSLVADGAIGRPEHLQHTMVAALSRTPLRPYGWLFDRTRGGGWIGAFGAHVIDFARWTFGEIVEATADVRTTIAERPDGDGTMLRCTAEDGFVARLRTATGVTVLIDSTFAAPVGRPPRTTVIGTEGIIETEADQRITLYPAGGEPVDVTPDLDGGNLYRIPAQRWAAIARDTARAGEAPAGAPTFADGLACAIVMDRLRGAG